MEWTWAEGDTFKFFDPRGFYIPVKVTSVVEADCPDDPYVWVEGPQGMSINAASTYWLQFGIEFAHGS